MEAEAQQPAVAGKRGLGIEDCEAFQIPGGQRHLAEAFRIRAHEAHDPGGRAVGLDRFTRIGSLKRGPVRI